MRLNNALYVEADVKFCDNHDEYDTYARGVKCSGAELKDKVEVYHNVISTNFDPEIY